MLQSLRLARNLTLREVAHATGTSESVVCLWETFLREPRQKNRDPYSMALGITVGQLGRIIYEGRLPSQQPRPRSFK